jgi:transglutaminase-like putative cysteine protease
MIAWLEAQPRFSQHLWWVVGGLLLAIAPNAPDVHAWIVLLALGAMALRLTIEWRRWSLPPKYVRIVIAVAAMGGVLLTYRTLNGLEAGTAFLVLMGAMKLLETRNERDLTVLVFVAYFLLFAGFLYNQSLVRLPWMLLTAWTLTATLMRVHQSARLSMREALRLTGKMVLQALPLAIALFVLFPRLPGQFWAVPARSSASTGLDDEMSPGDVSDLSISSTIAFRARFEGELPPAADRYWRAIVLHDFDGRTWRRLQHFFPEQPATPLGPLYRYTLTIEPHHRPWVFALENVTQWPRERTRRAFDGQLVTRNPISNLSSFRLESRPHALYEGPLASSTRVADTRLGERNPRARQWAQQLYAQTGDAESFTRALLQKFREEEYFYTLEPPRLEADSVDDFLFNTRRGFCEHFASAFTFMARAAGIPAHVVLGYQGGEYNAMGDYLIVRQSDAHAWSEIWVEGKGWVRVDPTAAVAPERIEQGIEGALGEDEPVPGRVFNRINILAQARLAWDAMNTFWNDQVIEFGEQQQRSLLEKFGLEDADWRALGFGLVIALSVFFAALTGWLAWRYRPREKDPIVQVYAQLCRRFAKRALPRAPHEGPTDYLERVANARPELAQPLAEIRSLYVSLRYGPTPAAAQLSRLKFLVSQLKVG